MSTFLPILIIPLIIFTVFFVIYRSVSGKKSTKLKSIGWLELLIVYLCVLSPIGLVMGLGKMTSLIEKMPSLNSLGNFDSLARLVLILASFYSGVCLWKISKGAVRKVKIILIILLIFNVFVVEGIYSFAIYVELTHAGVSISDKALIDILWSDIAGSLFYTVIIVSWYMYLNRSRRVKEIYGTPLTSQIVMPETEMVNNIGTPITTKDGSID